MSFLSFKSDCLHYTKLVFCIFRGVMQRSEIHVSPLDRIIPSVTHSEKTPSLISKGSISKINNSFLEFSKDKHKLFLQVKKDDFLSKRFISHLFGDSYLQNSIHEGWFASDALMHMILILEDNQISSSVKEVLDDFKGCLSWHGKIMAYIFNEKEASFRDIHKESAGIEPEDVSLLEDSEEDEVSNEDVLVAGSIDKYDNPFLDRLVLDFKEAVANLAVGQKILFPGGPKGHSVLFECRRDGDKDYSFAVYNTGEGVEKHWMLITGEGVHKAQAVYRLSEITLDKFTEGYFFHDLIELKKERSLNFGEELYEVTLGQLEGVRDKAPIRPEDYMQSQRSGTCVWKMLSAYCRYNLPLIERKYLKLRSRMDVFQKWYELGHSLDCPKISSQLIDRLIVNYKKELYHLNPNPLEFSREELLFLGILKVKKTFDKYSFLLSDQQIQEASIWYEAFTGQKLTST